MSSMSVKDAKAGFSALVDEAAAGEFVTITRHGKPAAVLVSLAAAEAARKAMSLQQRDFAAFLMSFPAAIDDERSLSQMRDVDL